MIKTIKGLQIDVTIFIIIAICFIIGLSTLLYLNIFFDNLFYLPFLNIYFFSIYGYLGGSALYFIIKPFCKQTYRHTCSKGDNDSGNSRTITNRIRYLINKL